MAKRLSTEQNRIRRLHWASWKATVHQHGA